MSSLVKEDLAKRLFGPRRLRLQEFIEVEGSGAERCYLCAAVPPRIHHQNNQDMWIIPTVPVLEFGLHCTVVSKSEEVEICMVKHFRDREEKYEVVEKWFLKDLEMIDGKEADTDNPYFDMHFHKVYSMEAYSCASKYTFARTLSNLNETYLKKDLKIVNFDSTYLNDDSIWSSNNRDCLVLMRICFYASNLLCLSLCPLS
ncbi:exocyst complex component 1-like isoform X1 [Lagopus muta]|uniref:exocyst complex component 1-like isoform X1 n=1 Tax=Lagopus muta TaxID=64668 RepID=UPI0020A2143B|nr:exocyst complex component 1-like isoform X1 [Lagopus muta]